jgi:hypothetical protein
MAGDLPSRAVELVAALDLVAEGDVVPRQSPFFHGAVDDQPDLVDLEGLRQVVERAGLHGGNGGLGGRKRGDHDNFRVGPGALGRGQNRQAVGVGHSQIRQDHVEGARLDGSDGIVATGGGLDPIAFSAQINAEEFAHRALIVNDENVPVLAHHPRLRATRMRNPPKLRKSGKSHAARSARSKRRDSTGRRKTFDVGVNTRTPRMPTYSTSAGK